MKKIRTFLAALTAVTMCVGAVPVAQVHLPQVSITASAEDLTYDNLTYRIEGDETKTVTITGCDKNAISIDIPAEIDGLPVTKIGTYAFQSHENLVKAIFPSSILTMGERVFNGDKSLRTVTLPGFYYESSLAVGKFSHPLKGKLVFLSKNQQRITGGSLRRPIFGNKLPMIQRLRFQGTGLFNTFHQIIAQIFFRREQDTF